MRPLLLLIMGAGLLGAYYIALHFKDLPFISYFGKKKKWLPWTIAIVIALILWYFSAVKITFVTAFTLYLVFCYAITDIIHLILKIKPLKETKTRKFWDKYVQNGLIVLIVVSVITIGGAINAKVIHETDYNIQINKVVKKQPLHIAMIADLHIGTGINKSELKKLDENVNSMHADVVCMVGDVVDEHTTLSEMKQLQKSLSNIKCKYGIYYVYGNHDQGKYNSEHPWGKKQVEATLKGAGVHILEDKSVLIDHRFYLVGRKDYSMTAVPERAEPRKTIAQLTSDLNKKYPIILLDHRSYQTKKSAEAGVDLQLSGHTHAGQLLYCWGTIAKRFLRGNDVIYGYKKIGNYNIVVTSGYGTWSMPERIGSDSEMVKVNLTGK